MRHGTSNRRTRNRNNNGGGNKAPNKNRVFDSSGPEVRIRGTAHQINEKYMALAKDAESSGDHTLAQSYMQHAEHYQRVINEWMEQQQPKQVAKPISNQDSEDDTLEPVVTESTKVEEKVLEEA